MGRLLPQKPPRRYPSGFCNLLTQIATGMPHQSFTCGLSGPGAVPGPRVVSGTGFHRCLSSKHSLHKAAERNGGK